MVDIMFGMPQLKLVFAKANELLPETGRGSRRRASRSRKARIPAFNR
jgi:hypothetical protein